MYTEIYGDGSYGLYALEEFDKYILRLMSFNKGRAVYYKTDECKIATAFMKEIGVLDGIYGKTLSPDENITIREALAIMSNGYNEFGCFSG